MSHKTDVSDRGYVVPAEMVGERGWKIMMPRWGIGQREQGYLPSGYECVGRAQTKREALQRLAEITRDRDGG